MGRNAAVSAASALRLLASPDMRQHPRTTPAPRRSAPTTPGTPLNVGLLDYLADTVNEVVTHTRSLTAGQTLPAPAHDDDLYTWYIEHTGDADAAEQAHRDYVIERHALEHAVRLGETDTVCKHPCPRCGCWGLEWDQGGNRALCLNRRCRTPDGTTSTWTLARLATQKVRRTEVWRRNAT